MFMLSNTSTPCRRFAEYFTQPALISDMPEDILIKTINAFEKRYIEDAKEDEVRIRQVGLSMGRKNHPFNHLHHGESFRK